MAHNRGLSPQYCYYKGREAGRAPQDGALSFLRNLLESLIEHLLRQVLKRGSKQQSLHEDLECLGSDRNCAAVLELEQHFYEAVAEGANVARHKELGIVGFVGGQIGPLHEVFQSLSCFLNREPDSN